MDRIPDFSSLNLPEPPNFADNAARLTELLSIQPPTVVAHLEMAEVYYELCAYNASADAFSDAFELIEAADEVDETLLYVALRGRARMTALSLSGDYGIADLDRLIEMRPQEAILWGMRYSAKTMISASLPTELRGNVRATAGNDMKQAVLLGNHPHHAALSSLLTSLLVDGVMQPDRLASGAFENLDFKTFRFASALRFVVFLKSNALEEGVAFCQERIDENPYDGYLYVLKNTLRAKQGKAVMINHAEELFLDLDRAVAFAPKYGPARSVRSALRAVSGSPLLVPRDFVAVRDMEGENPYFSAQMERGMVRGNVAGAIKASGVVRKAASGEVEGLDAELVALAMEVANMTDLEELCRAYVRLNAVVPEED